MSQILDLKRIGCSDLGALLGRDEHREPVDLWARLVHGIDVEASAYVQEAGDWGRRLEHEIAMAGLAKLGQDGPLYQPPSLLTAGRDWQRYSLDRIAGVIDEGYRGRYGTTPDVLMSVGANAIYECKVRNHFSLAAQGWGEDGSADVSPGVLLQVTGQMEAVRADRDRWVGTDVPDVDHVDVLVLVDGQHLRHYPVPYDAELAGMLVQECERFWRDHVLTQTPPPLLYGEGTRRELQRRYPKLMGEQIADDAAESLAQELIVVKDAIKDLEKSEAELETRLLACAQESTKLCGKGWSFSQWPQDSLRWGELLKDIGARPEGVTAAEFKTITEKYRNPATRRVRFTEKGTRA